MEGKADTLKTAQQWAANMLIDSKWNVFRIVTTKPAKEKFQPVPKSSIINGYDYYAIFYFDEAAKQVSFRGFWPRSICTKPSKYHDIALWHNQMVRNLPIPMETEPAKPIPQEPPVPPPPAKRIDTVPCMFDLAVDYAAALPEVKLAIAKRSAAFNGEVDLEFLCLSTKEARRYNQLSWQVALQSHTADRKEWMLKELQLLRVRLDHYGKIDKFATYQQLLPTKRKLLRLRFPSTKHSWTCDGQGKLTMLGEMEGSDDELDRQLVMVGSSGEDNFIEVMRLNAIVLSATMSRCHLKRHRLER